MRQHAHATQRTLVVVNSVGRQRECRGWFSYYQHPHPPRRCGPPTCPVYKHSATLTDRRRDTQANGGKNFERGDHRPLVAIKPELCAAIFRARSRESSLLSHK